MALEPAPFYTSPHRGPKKAEAEFLVNLAE